MNIGIFNQFGALNSPPVFSAFCAGLDRLKIKHSTHNMSADVAVIWSTLWHGRMRNNLAVWQHYRSQSKPVIVLEVGMLKRGTTWKLGVNGVNGKGWFGSGMQPNRAAQLGLTLRPWTNRGSNIIIAPQRSDSEQWADRESTTDWIKNTIQKIQQHSDRTIVVRPHPRQSIPPMPGVNVQVPKRLSNSYDSYDFENQLSTAWAVINDSSGPGSQAILSGVPAFVGQHSLASAVGNHDLADIESPKRPDRTQWLQEIAHTEWTLEELASSVPMQRLLPGLHSC